MESQQRLFLNAEDVAWAAGFYCGEGSCYLRTRKGKNPNQTYVNPVIKIGQGDREVLDRFRSIFGVGRVNGPYKHYGQRRLGLISRKPRYDYSADGGKTVQFIIDAMWKHLGTEKREQARIVLEAWKNGRIGYEGRKYTAERPRSNPTKYLLRRNGKLLSRAETERILRERAATSENIEN